MSEIIGKECLMLNAGTMMLFRGIFGLGKKVR
jgi:hypothetical protein